MSSQKDVLPWETAQFFTNAIEICKMKYITHSFRKTWQCFIIHETIPHPTLCKIRHFMTETTTQLFFSRQIKAEDTAFFFFLTLSFYMGRGFFISAENSETSVKFTHTFSRHHNQKIKAYALASSGCNKTWDLIIWINLLLTIWEFQNQDASRFRFPWDPLPGS